MTHPAKLDPLSQGILPAGGHHGQGSAAGIVFDLRETVLGVIGVLEEVVGKRWVRFA